MPSTILWLQRCPLPRSPSVWSNDHMVKVWLVCKHWSKFKKKKINGKKWQPNPNRQLQANVRRQQQELQNHHQRKGEFFNRCKRTSLLFFLFRGRKKKIVLDTFEDEDLSHDDKGHDANDKQITSSMPLSTVQQALPPYSPAQISTSHYSSIYNPNSSLSQSNSYPQCGTAFDQGHTDMTFHQPSMYCQQSTTNNYPSCFRCSTLLYQFSPYSQCAPCPRLCCYSCLQANPSPVATHYVCESCFLQAALNFTRIWILHLFLYSFLSSFV